MPGVRNEPQKREEISMTAETTEARKSEEPALEDLNALADRAEKAVNKLSASLADSRRRRETLTAERGSLVLPARSQKDSSAQKRLYAIDEQLSVLDRDVRDDEAALSELNKQLSSARENLERAEWEAGRAGVRKMIEARLTGKTVTTVEKAVDALAAALQSATDEDQAIRVAMLKFEPSLSRETRPLQMAGFQRSRIAAWKLQNLIPVDTREFGHSRALADKKFADFDRQHYGELLQALDRLELVF
jgi:chromosome segregation ATPase